MINSCASSQIRNTNTVKFDNGATLTYLTNVEEYPSNEFPIISWDDAMSIATNKKILDVSISDHEGQTIDLAAGIDKSLDLIKLVQKESSWVYLLPHRTAYGVTIFTATRFRHRNIL